MIELVTIKNKIEQLNRKQQIEVLKIITKLDISYSENNNGVFFNLSSFNEEQLGELNDYISYVSDQEEALQELENVKNELSETFFSNKKNSIKESAANTIDA
jgi:predicted component of viral defense system (DUF524 family)